MQTNNLLINCPEDLWQGLIIKFLDQESIENLMIVNKTLTIQLKVIINKEFQCREQQAELFYDNFVNKMITLLKNLCKNNELMESHDLRITDDKPVKQIIDRVLTKNKQKPYKDLMSAQRSLEKVKNTLNLHFFS